MQIDDLLQEARLALLLAARSWRGDAALWTYARPFVKRALMDAISRVVEEELTEAECEIPADGTDPETLLAVRRMFDALPPGEREIAERRVIRGMAVRDIAQEMKLSKSDVDRRWQSAMTSLVGRAA